LASAAAGRTTSAANSVTTSTSICSSSLGVRSNRPFAWAAGTRLPAEALPARANARPAAPAVLKPALVTRYTVCSLVLRSPSRSIRSLWANLFNAATASPIGSRFSFSLSPCLPPADSTLLTGFDAMTQL
jgi:hypothetical protein